MKSLRRWDIQKNASYHGVSYTLRGYAHEIRGVQEGKLSSTSEICEKYVGCADYPMERDSVLLAFSFQESNSLDDAVCDEQGMRFRMAHNMIQDGDICNHRLTRTCGNGQSCCIDYICGRQYIILSVRSLHSPLVILQNTGTDAHRIFLEHGYFCLDGRREISLDMQPGDRKSVRFDNGRGYESIRAEQDNNSLGGTRGPEKFADFLKRIEAHSD